MRVILCLLLIGLTASIPGFAQENNNSYRLGRGLALGDTGIRLGGYASAHLEGLGSIPWSLSLNDLSLFVIWDNGKNLRFFSEIEGEDTLGIGQQQSQITGAANFRLERLYLDYLLTNKLTVRIGKLLTPVGQWNLIHADPLVWTSSRPVATDNLFSEHVTGIMAHGTIPIAEQALDYAVYADNSATLDPKPNENPNFDNALGLRLRYHLKDNLKIGLSYADFALQNSLHIRNHLLGFDFAWNHHGFAVNSEFVYRHNDAAMYNHAWQGYIQGVSPIITKLFAVARYEYFEQANTSPGQVGILGLAYRPVPAITWKLEYRLGVHNSNLAPDGLLASFSVLF